MKPVRLALALALLAAAGCETVEAPAPAGAAAPVETALPAAPGYQPPAAGTIVVVRHRDGTLETSRVLGAEGYAVTMLREGERVTRFPLCFRCGSPPDEGAGEYRALWPLEVGRSAMFRSRHDGDSAVRLHEVAVVGTETVETDFGPVEALVIEEVVTGPADGWRATRRQWFSPQLGWAVRSEWEAPGDSGGWALAAIALPR